MWRDRDFVKIADVKCRATMCRTNILPSVGTYMDMGRSLTGSYRRNFEL